MENFITGIVTQSNYLQKDGIDGNYLLSVVKF